VDFARAAMARRLVPHRVNFSVQRAGGIASHHLQRCSVSPANNAAKASFDILATLICRADATLIFRMSTGQTAGARCPLTTRALAPSPVLSCAMPTKLHPAAIGFEGGNGLLALAATSHPDFDTTPP
jgi:hypothetical protein